MNRMTETTKITMRHICPRYTSPFGCVKWDITEDFAEAKRRVGQFLDRVYNEKRLHWALGYLPPVEYEQSVLEQASLGGVVG